MKTIRCLSALLVACATPLASAQTVDPFYAGVYSITNLGSVAGVPTNNGGLTFKAGDPNTILLGGSANNSAGLFYSVPVIRGAGNHIVALGAVTALGFGTNNDGGVAYGPGGVLFYSEYSINNVGEVKPASASDSKTVALGPLGIPVSTGALNFVPPGYNGAGEFKVSSWSGGEFYTVTLAADGLGTFDLTGATLEVTLPGGPEGFAYVPLGSQLFPSQSMVVSEYSNNTVATYKIDGNGNPVLASRQTFIAGLNGAEGAAIDPLTGDFFFSTYGSSNQVIEVRGFAPPAPPTAIAPVPTLSMPGIAAATLLVLLTGLLPALRRRSRRA
ncbi:MAG: hypothetical protein ACREYD_16735 [Casimicrobiaceae bacterium]